jgi:hypothetical protein
MVGFPGPSLMPVVRLIVHPPTVPENKTQLPVPQGVPVKTPESDAPLLRSSWTVAIAFEANPAANSGAAASTTGVRSFLLRDAFITKYLFDKICIVGEPKPY